MLGHMYRQRKKMTFFRAKEGQGSPYCTLSRIVPTGRQSTLLSVGIEQPSVPKQCSRHMHTLAFFDVRSRDGCGKTSRVGRDNWGLSEAYSSPPRPRSKPCGSLCLPFPDHVGFFVLFLVTLPSESSSLIAMIAASVQKQAENRTQAHSQKELGTSRRFPGDAPA